MCTSHNLLCQCDFCSIKSWPENQKSYAVQNQGIMYILVWMSTLLTLVRLLGLISFKTYVVCKHMATVLEMFAIQCLCCFFLLFLLPDEILTKVWCLTVFALKRKRVIWVYPQRLDMETKQNIIFFSLSRSDCMILMVIQIQALFNF